MTARSRCSRKQVTFSSLHPSVHLIFFSQHSRSEEDRNRETSVLDFLAMVAGLRAEREPAESPRSPPRRLLAVSVLVLGTVLLQQQPEQARIRGLPTAEERSNIFRQEASPPPESFFPSLRELLAEDDPALECPEGLHPVHDSNRHLLPEDNEGPSPAAVSGGIPRIVHLTLPSRCVSEAFRKTIDRWRFANYTVLVHDDDAVDRLLGQSFPEFPELPKVVHCLLSGAGKADLWRALVLWQYGGIYSDADSAPNTKFEEGGIIKEDDEAFFVVEQGGWPSQYFMASVPRHPLMYLLISKIVQRLYSLNEVDKQYVPRSTGPGALKYAFIAFMNDQGPNIYEGMRACNGDRKYEHGEVTEKKYTGWDNRTVTIVGEKGGKANEYVIREAFKGKKKAYEEMGTIHFTKDMELHKDDSTDSCFRRIYERERVGLGISPPSPRDGESPLPASTPMPREPVVF